MSIRSFPHARKLFLFVLLNVADLVLTWCLIRRGNGEVYEGNPIAGWWLRCHGWLGLAGFKMTVVALTAVLLMIACVYQPRTGGRAVLLGCALVAAVLVYSGFIARASHMRAAEDQRGRERAAYLERELAKCQGYHQLHEGLRAELAFRHCTLRQAVDCLAATAKGRDPKFLQKLHIFYPGCSDEECLAANLIESAVLTAAEHEPAAARRLSIRLGAEFRACFGTGLPYHSEVALAGHPASAG